MKNDKTRRMIHRLARDRKEWASFREADLKQNPTTSTVHVTLGMMKTGRYQVAPDLFLSKEEKMRLRDERRKLDLVVSDAGKALRAALEALRREQHTAARHHAAAAMKLGTQALELAGNITQLEDVKRKVFAIRRVMRDAQKVLARLGQLNKEKHLDSVSRLPARAGHQVPAGLSSHSVPAQARGKTRPHSAGHAQRTGPGAASKALAQVQRPASAAPSTGVPAWRRHRRSVGFGGEAPLQAPDGGHMAPQAAQNSGTGKDPAFAVVETAMPARPATAIPAGGKTGSTGIRRVSIGPRPSSASAAAFPDEQARAGKDDGDELCLPSPFRMPALLS